ncbi:putative methyltransferase At1g29790 [Carex rostrata]
METRQELPSKPDPKQNQSLIKLLFLFISTNLLSILLFSNFNPKLFLFQANIPLLLELEATQSNLSFNQAQIKLLQVNLKTTISLLNSHLNKPQKSEPKENNAFTWLESLKGELRLAVGPHKLPLGYTPNLRTDTWQPPIGSMCQLLSADLARYMTYEVGGECPSDAELAQKLMLRGCEPLPRRRCRSKSPARYIDPTPLPESLWQTPPDTSVVWDDYTCKNYSCLVHRAEKPGSYDCKDCFNLHGREKTRWLRDDGGINFSIDQVLKLISPGTVRIGLDIGGGTGTFAARMREHNINIVTTTMNFNGPFNSFIASRGLVPVHLTVGHRLPFFESTLDLVHSMHVISNWIPGLVLEFLLYDVYRVLRPGGLFWLDRFFCVGPQMNETYVPIINKIGFNRLRWHEGRKMDRGERMNEWYLSAVLQKPIN